MQSLTALSKLKVLVLAGCERITNAALHSVALMTGLVVLDLKWCRLSDVGEFLAFEHPAS